MSALKNQLKIAGIDVAKWGIGEAKTINHLKREIEEGEIELVIDTNGRLFRKVEVSGADVLYTSPEGKKYRLKESKQIFKDGRERHRDLGQAVSEKIKLNEKPTEAIIRGITEELGINGPISFTNIGIEQKVIDSPSYPGFLSQFTTHKFRLELNDEQFNPKGYIEKQSDKNTYFIWEEV